MVRPYQLGIDSPRPLPEHAGNPRTAHAPRLKGDARRIASAGAPVPLPGMSGTCVAKSRSNAGAVGARPQHNREPAVVATAGPLRVEAMIEMRTTNPLRPGAAELGLRAHRFTDLARGRPRHPDAAPPALDSARPRGMAASSRRSRADGFDRPLQPHLGAPQAAPAAARIAAAVPVKSARARS